MFYAVQPLHKNLVLLLIFVTLFIMAGFSADAQEPDTAGVTVYLEFKAGTGSLEYKPSADVAAASLSVIVYVSQNLEAFLRKPLPVYIFPISSPKDKQEIRPGRNTVIFPTPLPDGPVNLGVICGTRFIGTIVHDGTGRVKEMTFDNRTQETIFRNEKEKKKQIRQDSLKEVIDPDEKGEFLLPEKDRIIVDQPVPAEEKEKGPKSVYWHLMAGFGTIAWPDYVEDIIHDTDAVHPDLETFPVSLDLDLGVYWRLRKMENSYLGVTLYSGMSETYKTQPADESLYIEMNHGPLAMSYMQFYGLDPAEGWFFRCDASLWGYIAYRNGYFTSQIEYSYGTGLLFGGGYALGFGGTSRMTFEFRLTVVVASKGTARSLSIGIGTLF